MSSKLKPKSELQNCERAFLSALGFFIPSLDQVNRWLIGHSGGLDSQVLLFLAARLLPQDKILVVHVNHQLQKEADDWALFSQQQAELLGLASIQIKVELESSSENAARQARYAAFDQILEQGDCLLLGHHADDQAETLLFRMLRGTGLAGAKGMPQQRQLAAGQLIRPLLECSRQQLQQVAEGLALAFVEDPSNQVADYDRNYLRLKVMPLLKKRWPQLLSRWQSNANLMAEEASLLEFYLDRDLASCLSSQGSLNLDLWERLDLIQQDAVLRHWLWRQVQVRLNKTQITQIRSDLVAAKADAQPIIKLASYCLRRYKGELYITLPPADDIISELSISSAGKYDLGDGVLEVSFPEESLSKALKLVRRQGGEQCQIAGHQSPQKVKKMLQAQAILPWHRSDWPLLYSGEVLIAVPGICVSEQWQQENPGFSVLWCPRTLSD